MKYLLFFSMLISFNTFGADANGTGNSPQNSDSSNSSSSEDSNKNTCEIKDSDGVLSKLLIELRKALDLC